MAVVQLVNLVTDTPLSGASPLPHKPRSTIVVVSGPGRVGKHISTHLMRIHAGFHQGIQRAVDHRR